MDTTTTGSCRAAAAQLRLASTACWHDLARRRGPAGRRRAARRLNPEARLRLRRDGAAVAADLIDGPAPGGVGRLVAGVELVRAGGLDGTLDAGDHGAFTLICATGRSFNRPHGSRRLRVQTSTVAARPVTAVPDP